MTFLNPGLLWALLAISIPIIIHFFNFRRLKKVNFSNISLLKTVNTQAKTFLKLKQWLVLASRILFISSLVLAFAQPFLPAKNGLNNDGRSITSFYIDNSASMQNETENISALNSNLKKVEKLSIQLPKSSKNQLITNDFTSNDFKTYNSAELKNEISKIEISGEVKTIGEIYDRQKSILEKNSSSSNNNVFIFSDFQKSTIGDFSKILQEKNNKLFLVPSNFAENSNVYVDSVWLDNPFIRKMQANGLSVRLKNSGNKAIKNLPIKLSLGDLQLNSIPTQIEPNASTTIHFDFTNNQNGNIRGKINFEDNPVSFDNEYYFVLNASPSINVFHLYDNLQNNYLKNAFSNDSLFKFSSFPIFNTDFGLIKNADLLVLEGVESFNNNATEAIKLFLNNGGSVLIIPAENPDLGNYNAIFNNYGIKNLTRNGLQNKELRPLAEPPKGSTFYNDIFETTKIKDRLLMPSSVELLSWQTLGENILKTKGGQNFLSFSKTNKATVFMIASPLSDNFGNFPQNALFVPILYKIAAMSIKSSQLAHRFDAQSITIQDKNFTEKTIVKLKKEDLEMIPVQRFLGNEINFELPKTSEFENKTGTLAGFYDIIIGNSITKTIALNFSNRESIMDRYSNTELKNIIAKNPNIQLMEQADANALATEYASISQGKYLWKYFVIIALIFLLFEILIIRFWR